MQLIHRPDRGGGKALGISHKPSVAALALQTMVRLLVVHPRNARSSPRCCQRSSIMTKRGGNNIPKSDVLKVDVEDRHLQRKALGPGIVGRNHPHKVLAAH